MEPDSYAAVIDKAFTLFMEFIKVLGGASNPAVLLAGAGVLLLFGLLAVVFIVASKSGKALSVPALVCIGTATFIVMVLIAVGFVPQILDAQADTTPNTVSYEGVYNGKPITGQLSFRTEEPGLWVETNNKPDERHYLLVYNRNDRLVMLEQAATNGPRRVLEIATGVREIRFRWLGENGSRSLYRISKVE